MGREFAPSVSQWNGRHVAIAMLGTDVLTIKSDRQTLLVRAWTGGKEAVWQYIGMLILMALMAWSFESRTAVWTIELVLSLAWLVCALSVTAILLLMYMIREGETAKVASYFYLVPPMAAAEAWVLFGESLSMLSMATIAVTVAGVYLVVKKNGQEL